MASVSVDELRQMREGGTARPQSKRTRPDLTQKVVDVSAKAVPEDKAEKAKKTQEAERKKAGSVQEQRKVPPPKADDGATPATKTALDEKREKVRKLREQQEQERIRKLEAQKLKEEERIQAALEKKREILLAAQKKQEERKMKPTEPVGAKGPEDHTEKVKKAREQLELERKKRLETHKLKEQQRSQTATDRKKQVGHSAAQSKPEDKATAPSKNIKKVTSIVASKRTAGPQHLPSKKVAPHRFAAAGNGGKDLTTTSTTVTLPSTDSVASAGTEDAVVKREASSTQEARGEGGALQHGEEAPAPKSSSDSGSIEVEEREGGSDVVSIESGERESQWTGEEGSRTSMDVETLEPHGTEEKKDEEKERVCSRSEQEAAERRKRVDEIMRKAREDKKQYKQGLSASSQPYISSESISLSDDTKNPSEHGLCFHSNDPSLHQNASEDLPGTTNTETLSSHSDLLCDDSDNPVSSVGDSLHLSNDLAIPASREQSLHDSHPASTAVVSTAPPTDIALIHTNGRVPQTNDTLPQTTSIALPGDVAVPPTQLSALTSDPVGDAHITNQVDIQREDNLLQVDGDLCHSEASKNSYLCQESELSGIPHPDLCGPGSQARPLDDQHTSGLSLHQNQSDDVHHDKNEEEKMHSEFSADGDGGESNSCPPELPASDPPVEVGESDLNRHGADFDQLSGDPPGQATDDCSHYQSNLEGGNFLLTEGSSVICEDMAADRSHSSSVDFEEGSDDVLKLLEED